MCSVGTADPWNAAGLGLDVLALRECGAYAVTVTAGLSAQDGAGVRATLATPAGFVAAQFASLATAGIAAYRIGALLDVATVRCVAAHVRDVRVPVVYDPVLAASAGGRFADDETLRAIRDELLPYVSLVTPNLGEASALTGERVTTPAQMQGAGERLVARGARAALVTGGHLTGDPCDVLVDGHGAREFTGTRLTSDVRGTGCLLAAAAAAALARGDATAEAVAYARAFVRAKIRSGIMRGAMRVAY